MDPTSVEEAAAAWRSWLELLASVIDFDAETVGPERERKFDLIVQHEQRRLGGSLEAWRTFFWAGSSRWPFRQYAEAYRLGGSPLERCTSGDGKASYIRPVPILEDAPAQVAAGKGRFARSRARNIQARLAKPEDDAVGRELDKAIEPAVRSAYGKIDAVAEAIYSGTHVDYDARRQTQLREITDMSSVRAVTQFERTLPLELNFGYFLDRSYDPTVDPLGAELGRTWGEFGGYAKTAHDLGLSVASPGDIDMRLGPIADLLDELGLVALQALREVLAKPGRSRTIIALSAPPWSGRAVRDSLPGRFTRWLAAELGPMCGSTVRIVEDVFSATNADTHEILLVDVQSEADHDDAGLYVYNHANAVKTFTPVLESVTAAGPPASLIVGSKLASTLVTRTATSQLSLSFTNQSSFFRETVSAVGPSVITMLGRSLLLAGACPWLNASRFYVLAAQESAAGLFGTVGAALVAGRATSALSGTATATQLTVALDSADGSLLDQLFDVSERYRVRPCRTCLALSAQWGRRVEARDGADQRLSKLSEELWEEFLVVADLATLDALSSAGCNLESSCASSSSACASPDSQSLPRLARQRVEQPSVHLRRRRRL